jgi:class 3 adenylate cyclase
MIEAPEIRYTRSSGVSLAWQAIGDHPVDVIEVAGVFAHLEAKWEEPGLARWMSDIARFARLILFDRRGVGLSDRIAGDVAPTMEQLVADVEAVLDAARSREAVVVGIGDGGKVAAAFAAAHPERTRALVLYNSIPLRSEWEGGLSRDEMVALIEQGWGTGVMAGPMGDDRLRAYFARVERRACTPRAAAVMLGALAGADLGDALARVRAPTTVLHFGEHPGQPAAAARLAAAAIPGAHYREMAGYSADAQVRERRGLAGAIEELVTGTVSVRDDDRVLAAVLFTDIVGSTEKMAELGDLRWKELLDEHDRLAAKAVDAARGHVVKSTGDGMLAYFDGAARAVGCARAMMAGARRIGLPLRVSVHVGDCERRGDDIGGMTVHIAARVLALSGANEVLVTSTVREALVGTDIVTEARGEMQLRGVPGSWRLFVVV